MPPTGNQPSFTANSTVIMMPSQKLGAAKKNTAPSEIRLSQMVLTLTDASTPAVTPTRQSDGGRSQHQDDGGRQLLHDDLKHRRVLPVGEPQVEPHHRPDVLASCTQVG